MPVFPSDGWWSPQVLFHSYPFCKWRDHLQGESGEVFKVRPACLKVKWPLALLEDEAAQGPTGKVPSVPCITGGLLPVARLHQGRGEGQHP